LGAGTTVALGGAATAEAIADPSGNYSFRGLATGTYTITPKKLGILFTPASHTVTITGAPVTVSFTAAAQTWDLSGAVIGSAATLTLSGTAAASTTTDSTGKFSFSGISNGSYVVAPSRAGYTFNPSTAAVNIDNASAAGVNFTAQAIPPTVTLNWSASTSLGVTGYNVYRATITGGPYAKVNSSPVAALTYADGSVSAGQVYFYVATAVDSAGKESTYSTEASATVPAP
jgi:hypothetical protein